MYIKEEKIPFQLRLSSKKNKRIIDRKVKEIKSYSIQSGFKKAIIGVSGGLDSAVSTVLITRALGNKNVYLAYLPYQGISNKKSLIVIKNLVNNLKIPKENLIIIPINKSVDQNWKSVSSFKGKEKIRIGNFMARERMKILFDLSSVLRAIVMGTENKTEERLGYFTIGGDHCSGLEPILDLWKIQVFQLGEKLKEIPKEILNKTPSAELWEGQTDEKEIGASYLEIDTILFAKEELKLRKSEINQKFGISLKTIDLIFNQAKKAEGKRNLPHILEWKS